MELNGQSLLTISILSLILSFSVKAHIPTSSPSPSPSPPLSHISSTPNASPEPAPVPPPPEAGIDHLTSILGSYVIKGASDAELSLDFLTKRAKDSSVSLIEAECIEQCIENYNAIVDDFKKAQDNVVVRDYYMLSEDLSAVSADIDACQECFKEMLGGDSPLGKFEESITAAASHGLDMLQYTS